jgi:glycosyltransferase involved in cell wall biosynthesis
MLVGGDREESEAGPFTVSATPEAPVRVVQIDLSEAVADVDCTRPQMSPYRAAWVLVRQDGIPLGNLMLEAIDGKVSAQRLQAAAAEAFPSRPALRPRPSEQPRVSVIVPTAMTRVAQLQASLASLAQLDYPDFEVILVDNHPGDHPPVELSGVRVVREHRPGLSAARNAGLAAATGAIIAYTDDDVEVDRDWLKAIVVPFVEDPRTAIVTGSVFPYELESPAQIWFERYYGVLMEREYSPLRFERTRGFGLRRTDLNTGAQLVYSIYKTDEFGIGANMAMRASAIREIGGFDRALGAGTPASAGEETVAFLALLMKRRTLVYAPDAIVWHKHRDSIEALERQTRGYGVGMTAMLTALLLRTPVHFFGLASVVPTWLRTRLSREPSSHATDGPIVDDDQFLARLDRLGRSGKLRGPLAYLQGTWMQRRWRPDRAPAPPTGESR